MNQTPWYPVNALESGADFSLLPSVPLEQDPRWLNSRITGPDKHIHYFLLGDRMRPCGYAPFFVHAGALAYCLGEATLFRIPVLRYAMQSAPLCENEALLPDLFMPLFHEVGRRGVVFFEGVQQDSHLANLLTAAGGPVKGLFHVVPYGPVYPRRLIELPDGSNFDDYLRTLGSKTREDVRRTRKNFAVKAGGRVTMIRYTEPEQAAELASAMAHISRKTYQYHLLGLGLENTPEQVRQLRAAADGRWLRGYILWIDDEPMAFGLGYRDGSTYYGHHVGYDPAISKSQPGIYLHTEVMKDLLADSICRFDFLPGDSLYKQRMSNRLREERHYYLIPRGWPGTGYARMLLATNFISERIGGWLHHSGLKERVKRFVRAIAIKRSGHDR
jgi:hypothetical protein